MIHSTKTTETSGALARAIPLTVSTPSAAATTNTPIETVQVHYRGESIDGVEIAYREAGDPARPTVLLLHGFPTSSHMYRNLIPELARRSHVLAPDFPGYGASAMPAVEDFEYSFANIARLMTKLIDRKGVGRYAVYLMDYGAPVGYRMFAADPKRVSALVIQNGNAYEEGLGDFWDPIRAYWSEPTGENGDKLRAFLTLDATKWQFTHGARNPDLISPDNFWHAQYLLDRPGNQEIQLALFLDYRANVEEYPKWRALFREHQPPALLMWGKNDVIFPEAGAHPYKRDLKNLEFHLLDTGHFALEEYGSVIARRMIEFLDRNEQQQKS